MFFLSLLLLSLLLFFFLFFSLLCFVFWFLFLSVFLVVFLFLSLLWFLFFILFFSQLFFYIVVLVFFGVNCGCGCCEVSLLAWWAESSGESSCGACVAWFPVEVAECGKFSSQSLSDVRFSSHLFCFPARLHGEWKQRWDFLLMRCIPHSTRTSLNGATAQGPRLQYASALNLHPSKLKQDGAMAQLDYRFTFIDVAAWSANACSSQSATPPRAFFLPCTLGPSKFRSRHWFGPLKDLISFKEDLGRQTIKLTGGVPAETTIRKPPTPSLGCILCFHVFCFIC